MTSGVIIPTISRYYTAIAQWLACLTFILVYWKQRRLKPLIIGLVSVGFLAVQVAEMVLTEALPLELWIPSILGAAALMFCFLFSCLDISCCTAGYCAVRCFILAELAASLEWQIYYYFVEIYGMQNSKLLESIFVAAVFAAVFTAYFFIERLLTEKGRCVMIRPRIFLLVLITGMAIFSLSNLSFVSGNTPFSGSQATEIYNIRTLVDLTGLAVLILFHYQQRESHIHYELEAIQNALEMQYTQYKMSRDTINVINRKYHDLKHQIMALRGESDEKKREAWLDTMEKEISFYETQNKTGDSVLDTVITGKSIYCHQHAITMTCVVDGKAIGFMDKVDVCTIFGNALDNAIEAVKQLEDEEKRLIHLTTSAQKGFVLIQVENYYEGQREFRDGDPVSTKQDDHFHGFGVKSIRYSAARYGGTVSIKTDNNWFDLRVLIPIPT